MSRPVRRSQAIAPFGIGAMIDFPGPVSLIHAGLDAWPFREEEPDHREFRIDDEKRLSRRLQVDYFVQPPDFRVADRSQDASQPNLNLKLPFLRFPLWHVCPRCGRMHLARYHDRAAPTCRGPIGSGAERGREHSPRKTIQLRFIAACKNGHLQDFPWLEWLFRNPLPPWRPDAVSRWLRTRSTGSASLAGVEIAAEEISAAGGEIRIIEKRTLAGAFNGDFSVDSRSAFGQFDLKCEGHNPALGIGSDTPRPLPGCGQELYPLLRGASNLYFPQVVSSIYIPEVSDRELSQDLLDLLDDHALKVSLLQSAQNSDDGLVTVRAARIALRELRPDSAVDPEALAAAANKHILKDILLDNRKIRMFLSQKMKIARDRQLTKDMIDSAIGSHCPDWAIDSRLLLSDIQRALEGHGSDEAGEDPAAFSPDMETDYRHEEYRVFCRDIQDGLPKRNLLIRSVDVADYGTTISASFERIAALHKLRETRAFVGFSRIFPENDLGAAGRWALIASERKRWLPATIVRGEGVFLKFREERLAAWMRRYGAFHESRLQPMNRNMGDLRTRRHQPAKVVSPKFVLLHTFAHLVINQLVYECGYGSASLRERIYAADGDGPMSGILIYTAAGDSEGTMGGLVKMGGPDFLAGTLARALDKAGWCSTDPVCIESRGQGPDNCNLGACHSCALLPETSCEEQNRLLDRGVVLGTVDHPETGFFSMVT